MEFRLNLGSTPDKFDHDVAGWPSDTDLVLQGIYDKAAEGHAFGTVANQLTLALQGLWDRPWVVLRAKT
jgi:hypothetical protein